MAGLKKESIEIYKTLSEKREKDIFENGILIFDSCALLNFYLIPKDSRTKIYDEIFAEFNDRLWLPNHVQFEFLKNRDKAIYNPIAEKYVDLKEKVNKIRVETEQHLVKGITSVENDTIKPDNHPHLDQTNISAIKLLITNFKDQLKVEEEKLLKQIEDVETELKKIKDDDDLLKVLETFFEIGREYSFDEIMEITVEGKHRYEFKIPPGYGDYYKKEKKGTQIFGDLIIWNQILEFSKKDKKSILFITDDITKDEDWCYLDKKNNRIDRPREELIKEIKDHSGVDFWMFNLPQFLYHANEHLKKDTATDKGMEQVDLKNIISLLDTSQLTAKLKSKGLRKSRLKFRCGNCGHLHSYKKHHLDLDFYVAGTDERNMGMETHYEAVEGFNCNSCGNEISVTFGVWEYPVGVHNYDDVQADGAILDETFPVSLNFHGDEEIDIYRCDECEGNRENEGNYVHIWSKMPLENQYPPKHKYGGYESVVSGDCDYCNSFHIRCPDCDGVTPIPEFRNNEKVECEGGCGLEFMVVESMDSDGVTEKRLELIDSRREECSGCGNEFIDENNTGICEKCEEEYNDK